MSGWTEEKRQRERDRINQTKPWLPSTGARTPHGKAISSQNAYKGGLHAQLATLNMQVKSMLREQKEALRRIG
ncbi:MAG: hypothetical protein H7Z73_05975 [Candidatus Saccharibacteria bacterium]|nr:hypothetical protein [Moraxellaceae bacterium]